MNATSDEENLEEIYRLIDDEKYEAANKLIEKIPEAQRDDSLLLFFKAMCIYEAGDYLECLRCLRTFMDESLSMKSEIIQFSRPQFV